MQAGLVSIVVPAYNAERFIRETIQSVINQSYKSWELIIVDDCSTDETPSIVVRAAKAEDRIRFLRAEHNAGTAAARNTGIREAKGQYLVFLDADDLLDDNFLEKQLCFLREKHAAIITAGYRRMAQHTITDFVPPSASSFKSILNGNPISCLTTMVDIEQTGKRYFNETFQKCEDYLFWLELLKDCECSCFGNQEVLATYRILETSKSRKKASLIKWMLAVYKEIKIPLLCRYYHLFRWAIYGLKKYRNVS